MNSAEPLASLIRPKSLQEYIGQSHLVGKGKPLKVAIKNGHLFSMIFYGPPGTGKTTLAKIYAKSLGVQFHELSAVSAGKADVKKVIDMATDALQPAILFLDEIHRFNKAQQDFLLPFVEQGTITLIGATTENPSFEIISPLLSRCRVFVLRELEADEMKKIIENALQKLGAKTDKKAKDWLISMANGDARQAITMLENTHQLYKDITLETLKNTLQNKHLRFDKKGEEHYNTISAFIKSMRASDPNAAIYYLARMIDGGEDPKFIARRMVIFASEDIGMAQPTALVVANEVFRAVETIGYPECAINLSHGVIYLATAKKDRRAYDALRSAQHDVKQYGNLPIPMHLRNATAKRIYNTDELLDHDGEQTLLPDKISKKSYYK